MDFCRQTDTEFKKEIVKVLKELRAYMNSNADYFKKETRKYEEPRQIRKFICREQT